MKKEWIKVDRYAKKNENVKRRKNEKIKKNLNYQKIIKEKFEK